MVGFLLVISLGCFRFRPSVRSSDKEDSWNLSAIVSLSGENCQDVCYRFTCLRMTCQICLVVLALVALSVFSCHDFELLPLPLGVLPIAIGSVGRRRRHKVVAVDPENGLT